MIKLNIDMMRVACAPCIIYMPCPASSPCSCPARPRALSGLVNKNDPIPVCIEKVREGRVQVQVQVQRGEGEGTDADADADA
jgi:hypothetical protein